MFQKLVYATLISTTLLFTQLASAVPIIGIDLDSTTPEIDSTLTVTSGENISINIFARVENSTDLSAVNAVALDITSSSSIIGFVSATVGDFANKFLAPVNLFNFSAAPSGSTLTPTPAPGLTGGLTYGDPFSTANIVQSANNSVFDVLMTIIFEANAVGTTTLNIVDLVSGLNAVNSLTSGFLPPVVGLNPDALNAQLTVVAENSGNDPVPTPAMLTVLLVGLLGLRKSIK